MFDCWRFVLRKKTGHNRRSSRRRADEAEKEEGDPQIDVPDVLRLVRDPAEGSHSPPGRDGFKPSFDPEFQRPARSSCCPCRQMCFGFGRTVSPWCPRGIPVVSPRRPCDVRLQARGYYLPTPGEGLLRRSSLGPGGCSNERFDTRGEKSIWVTDGAQGGWRAAARRLGLGSQNHGSCCRIWWDPALSAQQVSGRCPEDRASMTHTG